MNSIENAGRTVLALVLAAGVASVTAGAEDCIPFNPATVQAKQINGNWKVVDGDNWLLDFGASQANAGKAVSVIQFYHFNQICFVGRPNPPMMYFKTASGFPQGGFPGQDAIPFDPFEVKAEQIGGRWKVTCCDMWMLDFGADQSLAQQAVTIIQSNHLRYQCFVGRPHAPMMYFLADPAFVSPGPCFLVRKNIAHLSANEIATFRHGVSVMMGRSNSDPTSWRHQADMHGTYDTPAKPLWNQCQHGSFYFLSWHRMYLYFFERILRAASGSPSYALPYWDYTDTPGGQFLPAAFRVPGNSSNPLYVSGRDPSLNNGSAGLAASTTDYSAAFTDTIFESPTGDGSSFGGQEMSGAVHFAGPHGDLESQPHDIVHVMVGGPSGLMADPNTAAQDPIFWLHHCNIDRLWERWLRQGGGRSNPTGDQNWMNTKFSFYDYDGTQVTLTGAQVLDTAAQLRYIYEDQAVPAGAPLVQREHLLLVDMEVSSNVEPKQVKPAAQLETMGVAVIERSIPLMDKPVSAIVRLRPTGTNLLNLLRSETPSEPKRVILKLDKIQYESGGGVYYEIYLNLRDTTKANSKDPNYVGALALFGFKHHGMDMPVQQTYDVTRVVSRMLKEKLLIPDQPIKVVLIPRGLVDKNGKPLPIRVSRKASLGGVELLAK